MVINPRIPKNARIFFLTRLGTTIYFRMTSHGVSKLVSSLVPGTSESTNRLHVNFDKQFTWT